MERTKANALADGQLPAGTVERIGLQGNGWTTSGAILLAALMIRGSTMLCPAAEQVVPGQWNIMVVPARQTAYSGCARACFEKNCASCHSRDGRAQTPVARQRGVRDLSESTLTDEQIIEQILLGTHGKSVPFRMPPFNEKLSRPEVEALVPVIKAFRPVIPSGVATTPASPRLAGIIDFPNHRAAILEKVAYSGRYFLLHVNESHDGVQLLKIKPAQGTVRVSVTGTNIAVTLRLDPRLVQAGRADDRGWLSRLFGMLGANADPHHSLALNHVNTDLVMFLYAQLSGRTILRSPRIPAATYDLIADGNDPGQIARRVESALSEHGIAAVPDGSKFLLVVPAVEAPIARPRSAEIAALSGTNRQKVSFPGGAFINFPDTKVSEVLRFYASLTGRSLDEVPGLNSTGGICFTTQTPLTTAECVYALETLLSWQGMKVWTAGGSSASAVPVPHAGM